MRIRLPFARERRDSLENPSTDLVAALTALDDGGSTASGVSVSPEKALRLAAVYACVRVLAETAASLPLPVYRREGRSRVRVSSDPRWGLLNEAPNPEMTAMELMEMTVGYANTWGHGYEYAVRDGSGRASELWPLLPSKTRAVRLPSGTLAYITSLDSGEQRVLPAEDVIHVRAFLGIPPIRNARETIGSALAAQEYGARFFGNDGRPGGVIEVPTQMTTAQFDAFRAQWQAGHQGLKRSHLVGILTGGANWKQVGLPPGDLQLLDQRKFGVREIARIFRVPPHMIGDLEGTVTFASIEQQAIDFVVHSLRPWLVRVEQAIRATLFASASDRAAGLYPEFLVDGLLRGDTKSRYEAYAIARNWGWLSANDILELENRPAIEGGDQYLVPLNMVPAGSSPLAALAGADDRELGGQDLLLALMAQRSRALEPTPSMPPVINVNVPEVKVEPQITVEVPAPALTVDVGAPQINMPAPELTFALPPDLFVLDPKITVEAPQVTVNVDATPVSVNVEPTPVTVNVEPTPVTIEAPKVTVRAPVNVEPPVNVLETPPRKVTLKRDSSGKLVSATIEDA